jgi:hypothetical protein
VNSTATGEATSPKKSPHGRRKPQGQTQPTRGGTDWEGKRKNRGAANTKEGTRERTSFLFINKD